jgi:hypothetical protein
MGSPGRCRAAFQSECLDVFDGKFDNERAFVRAPSIAFGAAGKALAIPLNLDKSFSATVALHLASFFNYPRFLAKRDELVRPALHRFFVSGTPRRIVGSESNNLLDVAICVVPKFNAKRQIWLSLSPSYR